MRKGYFRKQEQCLFVYTNGKALKDMFPVFQGGGLNGYYRASSKHHGTFSASNANGVNTWTHPGGGGHGSPNGNVSYSKQ